MIGSHDISDGSAFLSWDNHRMSGAEPDRTLHQHSGMKSGHFGQTLQSTRHCHYHQLSNHRILMSIISTSRLLGAMADFKQRLSAYEADAGQRANTSIGSIHVAAYMWQHWSLTNDIHLTWAMASVKGGLLSCSSHGCWTISGTNRNEIGKGGRYGLEETMALLPCSMSGTPRLLC